ncbi:MAG: FecR domain-containing protein [Methylorubrum populi]
MSPTQQFEDAHAEAAIQWMVEMNSGEMSEIQVRAFETWLKTDHANETAWIRLQEGLMPCGIAARNGMMGHDVLTRRLAAGRQNRRTFIAGLASLIGVGTIGSGIADRFVPLGNILADRFTRTGGQETVALADGSELVLASRTAINIVYETGLRAVQLLDGEVLVRAASRATPFEIRAGSMALETFGGTFLVEGRAERLAVTGVEGSGRVRHVPGGHEPVASGDMVEFAGGHRRRRKVDIEAATAWLEGLLVAKDSDLLAITTQLQRYFSGIIQVDPAIADLRATGVFSLRNPEAALDALAESLDLSLTRVSRLWIKLGPAGRGAA